MDFNVPFGGSVQVRNRLEMLLLVLMYQSRGDLWEAIATTGVFAFKVYSVH